MTAPRQTIVVAQERVQLLEHVREEAAAGTKSWATLWRDADGENRAAADDQWLVGSASPSST